METTELKTYKLICGESYYDSSAREWAYPQNGIHFNKVCCKCPTCGNENSFLDVLDILTDANDVEFTYVECAECEEGFQLNIYGERQYIPHEMVLKELEEIE